MLEFERNCCDEKLMPTKEPDTICAKAARLLDCINHIDGLVERIGTTLFYTERNDAVKEPHPDCLESNIDLAFDSAKKIAFSLEKIIARL